ncbi:unnamed protein product [Lathyrus sativus]|nr:unnamed protein product [Lathyrus sativus]
MFALPISIITATTNQTPWLNIIPEYIFGIIYSGRPIANVCFKTYGYISMAQAVSFLSNFRLGHYMKISKVNVLIAVHWYNACWNYQHLCSMVAARIFQKHMS